MRPPLLLALFAAACAAPPAAPIPAPLPTARHGHRIERADGGLLCFGGFRPSRAADRGERETWRLADGDVVWRRCADLNHPHAFHGSAVVAGAVYAIGEAVERYERAADRWRVVVAPGALPRSHFAAAADDRRIYVLGGFPEVGTGFTIVDAASGDVTRAAPPPSFAHGDHFHFLVVLAGELHVLGGVDGGVTGLRDEHWVRRDGAWRRLADCPTPLWSKFGASAVVDGALYLFGDFGGLCYDPVADRWTARAGLPAPVAMPVAVPTADAIWILGGMKVEDRGRVFWRYDLADDRWQLL